MIHVTRSKECQDWIFRVLGNNIDGRHVWDDFLLQSLFLLRTHFLCRPLSHHQISIETMHIVEYDRQYRYGLTPWHAPLRSSAVSNLGNNSRLSQFTGPLLSSYYGIKLRFTIIPLRNVLTFTSVSDSTWIIDKTFYFTLVYFGTTHKYTRKKTSQCTDRNSLSRS